MQFFSIDLGAPCDENGTSPLYFISAGHPASKLFLCLYRGELTFKMRAFEAGATVLSPAVSCLVA